MPFLDARPRGIFATRAPTRPNPIGLSIVELHRIEGNTLHLNHVDVLDGTPLLDIKPYVPEFDRPAATRTGWLEEQRGRVEVGEVGRSVSVGLEPAVVLRGEGSRERVTR